MVRGSPLSLDQQKTIWRMHKAGVSQTKIAMYFARNRSTICSIIRRTIKRGKIEIRKHTGRHRKTNRRIDSLLGRMSRADPTISAPEMRRDLAMFHGVSLSVATVKRRLRGFGLYGRRPCRKPLVSRRNRRARMAFAKAHKSWTVNDWRRVIYTDESKFNLIGSDGIKYIRRPIGKRYSPLYLKMTVKHGGGNVKLWGCFSTKGVGPLVEIVGNMKGQTYKDILQDHLLPYARRNFGRGWVLLDDNDPKHRSDIVKTFLQAKRVTRLPWPAQSPDINPIENLWEELGRACSAIKCKNRQEKMNLLKKKWEEIPQSRIDALIDSMPHRIEAVIKARGFPTKY